MVGSTCNLLPSELCPSVLHKKCLALFHLLTNKMLLQVQFLFHVVKHQFIVPLCHFYSMATLEDL